MPNKKILFVWLVASLFVFFPVHAQTTANQAPQVNYNGQEPMDSDLDGLTDQAETQIYKTDPDNPDTDGDGYFDGTEVITGSNPLEKSSTSQAADNQASTLQTKTEIPWAWYVSRAAGLVGFAMLYISIFLGLIIRLPFMHKYFSPLLSLNGHRWISLQATIMALIHGGALMFDHYLNFRFVDVFVPFLASYQPGLVALGIISFYLMILLVVTSYGRKYLSQKTWRRIHFLNIALYVFTLIHAFNLGTDMKTPFVRNIFIYANVILIWLMLTNMYVRIKGNAGRKSVA